MRTQQETNQILQGQALQQIVGQKVQQDNLKSLFQTGNGYQQNFNYRNASANERRNAVGISLLSRLEAGDGLSDSDQKRL